MAVKFERFDPQLEAVLQASKRVNELREFISKASEELKQAESQLKRLIGGESPHTVLPMPTDESDKSLNQRIVDALDVSAIDTDMSAEEITATLRDVNLTSVRSALPRLADIGKIKRSARGRYQSIRSTQEIGQAV